MKNQMIASSSERPILQPAHFTRTHPLRWLSFFIRILLALAALAASVVAGIFHNWLLMAFLLLAALGFCPRLPKGRWLGNCPHCLNAIFVEATSPDTPVGLNCPLCARRLIAKGSAFECA